MMTVRSQTLGYPRIGEQRQMKRALESYWKGRLPVEDLLATQREVEEHAWKSQMQAGIDRIGVGDSTLYDHVADWADRLNIVPQRFQGLVGLDRYLAMARGMPGVPALELTKWFDTNYHYLVPEYDASVQPSANFTGYLETLVRARAILGERAVPIVLGPVTLLRLSRLGVEFELALEELLPLYKDLLDEVAGIGFSEVQLHEPALVLPGADGLRASCEHAYSTLAGSDISINFVTHFDDIGASLSWVQNLPIDILTIDFTRGQSRGLLAEHGWRDGLTLAAGVVDGRNIWRMPDDGALQLLDDLKNTADLRVSASCSLQFVPYTVELERELPDALRGVLAFAEQKLGEIALLAKAASGDDVSDYFEQLSGRWAAFRNFAPRNEELGQRLADLQEGDFTRSVDYEERRQAQVRLPAFPTTTIGSFPQTSEIRKLRASFRRGEISEEQYRDRIDAWIAYTIGIQEGLGLDVLVHGEFERSDMVEYFAQKLEGFAFTRHGWVQSYGSRYVRPPIIYGDVWRPEPMTVREFERAQSFTAKPVKGMLTGPVTILNWSFPRVDIPSQEIAFQIALALRDEIGDLETVQARVVQVDEPALREGLPFKRERWDDYLSWAVGAFRLATGGAQPATQIHTHMCYAEFGDILQAIDRLNADVISIENARSDDETLRELAAYSYRREVGPGVYDVHSPVIPDQEEVAEKLRTFANHLNPQRLWVNPDCGLKTRAWDEVIPALTNLVAAADQVRSELELQSDPAGPVAVP